MKVKLMHDMVMKHFLQLSKGIGAMPLYDNAAWLDKEEQ